VRTPSIENTFYIGHANKMGMFIPGNPALSRPCVGVEAAPPWRRLHLPRSYDRALFIILKDFFRAL
jgi:hypothetical protein